MRTMSVVTVIGPRCADVLVLQHGGSSGGTGIFDTFLWLVLGAGGFLIATACVGLIRRNFTGLDIGLGVVNAGFVLVLLLSWSITWAFNHPHAPMAARINGLGNMLGGHSIYETLEPWSPPPVPRSSNWEQIGEKIWRNETLGLIHKTEIVGTCFNDTFIAANRAARSYENSDETPGWATTFGEAYYGLDGRYLSAGRFYPGSDSSRGNFVPYYFLPLARRGEAGDILMLTQRLEEDWRLFLEETPPPVSRPGLYTREKIDALVMEAWDDIE